MRFQPYRVLENRRLTDDLSVLVFDQSIQIQPGQFVFVWLPGVGEKPFSVLDDRPFTLAIQQRGCVTATLCRLQPGNVVYVRGPYGIPVEYPNQAKTMLVCGGCGLAALYQLARKVKPAELVIGAKSSASLFYLEQARALAEVHIATEDGSVGYRGLVTDLLQHRLQERQPGDPLVFYNCGPAAMIDEAVRIEQRYTTLQHIYTAIDYVTKCGVGLCGSCATPDGRRLCVDGAFMSRTS
jgi:dihydroorotate dehydrogenase (NAD+) catalytic subunit